MDWLEVQDATQAALIGQIEGWKVADAVGFPGMDALDSAQGGIVWVDAAFDSATFSGSMAAADGGIEPVGVTFPIVINAYWRYGPTQAAVRARIAALEAELLAIVTGAEFMASTDFLTPTSRSFKTGQYDERFSDGLYSLTLTWSR